MQARFLNLAIVASALISTAAIAADTSSSKSQRVEEDIAVYREKFLAVDKSFTRESRAAAEARLEKLKQRSASVSPTEFVVELCRIAVLADNGHTGCMSKAAGVESCRQWALIEGKPPLVCDAKESALNIPDFETVAIGFRPFLSEFHVIAVPAESSELLGARLLAVNGKSVQQIRQELRSFSAGRVGFRDLTAAGVLASPERLHAAGLGDQARSVSYEFLTTKERTVQRTFELGAKSGSMVQGPANAPSLPWALQESNAPFRFRDAPDLDAVIIQLRQNVDSPSEKIELFLRKSEANRARLGRKNVVLDMRFNSGGNLVATRDFMVSWPALVPGRFYVLTSSQTFSAGMVSTAYLKQSGADRVVIVGEPVGDRLMYFSDGRPVRLPNSGLMLYAAQVRTDLQDGCRQYDDCFAGVAQPGRPAAPLPVGALSIKRMPVSVGSLDPDIAAPWTIESWIDSTDPMLEAVHRSINKPR